MRGLKWGILVFFIGWGGFFTGFAQAISPVSSPALQVVPPSASILENEPLTMTLSVSDPLPGSYIFSVSPTLTNAALESSTGIFRFTPDFLQAGTYRFQFTAQNGAQSLIRSASVEVRDNNRPPQLFINFAGTLTLYENETADITLLGIDPDSDNTLTYSASPELRNLILDSQTGKTLFHPGYDQAGKYSIVFSVSDGQSVTSATRTLEVLNVNRPPQLVLNPSENRTIFQGETFNLLASASDPDNDPLTLRISQQPPNSTFDTQTGRFSITPSLEQYREQYSLIFSVTDTYVETSQSLTLTIDAAFSPFWDFAQEGNFEGWSAAKDIESLAVENGVLKGIASGNDPILLYSGLHIDTFSQHQLVFRAWMNFPSPFQIFLITDQGRFYGPVTIDMATPSAFVTYALDFGGLLPQPEIIETLRIDPGFRTNVFSFDMVGFPRTDVPTRTPTPNPIFSPTPTRTPTQTPAPTVTPTATSTPSSATPTPTFTPSPTATPIPTPVPTFLKIDFDQHQALDNAFEIWTPPGYQPALVVLSDVPPLPQFEGYGLLIHAQPGEAAFLISKASYTVQDQSALLDVSVLSSTGNPAFALIALNSPLDGQLAYHLAENQAVPSGLGDELKLIYHPPHSRFQIGLQLANPPESKEDVFVLFDNLRVSAVTILGDLAQNIRGATTVATDPDGSFDGDLSHLITNLNLMNGSVQTVSPSVRNQALKLSVNEEQTAANAATLIRDATRQLPGFFIAEAYAGRYLGNSGTLALALTNGKHSLVLFEDTAGLPTTGITRQLILGGNLEENNPAMTPFLLIQNARTDAVTSILIDNLRLWKIASGF